MVPVDTQHFFEMLLEAFIIPFFIKWNGDLARFIIQAAHCSLAFASHLLGWRNRLLSFFSPFIWNSRCIGQRELILKQEYSIDRTGKEFFLKPPWIPPWYFGLPQDKSLLPFDDLTKHFKNFVNLGLFVGHPKVFWYPVYKYWPGPCFCVLTVGERGFFEDQLFEPYLWLLGKSAFSAPSGFVPQTINPFGFKPVDPIGDLFETGLVKFFQFPTWQSFWGLIYRIKPNANGELFIFSE